MRKVLIAFDGTNFSEGAYEFARKMNEKQGILLTGAFLPQSDYANLWSFANAAGTGPFIPLIEPDAEDTVGKNKKQFMDLCARDKINFRVHEEFFDFTLPELKKESRYADLIILGSESFYEKMSAMSPNEFLTDVLHDTECPVVIVPEHFEFPGNTILSYDGSSSSVYAIKQFAYLFPELAGNDTLMVHVEKSDSDGIKDSKLIKEFVQSHFPKLTVTTLNIEPKKYFSTWLSERGNTILVSGAFGRSRFSEAVKKSFVADIISDHKIPVFIAHR